MNVIRNILLALAVLLLSAAPALARDVTLAWDANPEADVIGYKVYYKSGSSSLPFDGTGADQGNSPVDVGNELTATLTGLADGDIYYFAITAYNADGLESPYSNIVANDWVPTLLSPEAGETVSAAAVEFSWSEAPAGADAIYTLYYGTDPSLQGGSLANHTSESPAVLAGAAFFGLLGVALARRRLFPIVAVGLLTAFLVAGCGGGGGGSDAPPVPVINPGDNSGSDATSPIEGTSIVSGIRGTTHTLHDLHPGTTYYWKVVSTDARGENRESEVGTFTTGR